MAAAQELVFPRVWEYRITVEAPFYDGLRAMVEDFCLGQGRDWQLAPGMSSKSGKYRSLILSVTVESKAAADEIGSRLAVMPGVRFLL